MCACAQLIAKSRASATDLLRNAVAGEDEGFVKSTTRGGIQVYQGRKEGTPLLTIRGSKVMPKGTTVQMVTRSQCEMNTAGFCNTMKAIDAMFIDGHVGENLEGRPTMLDAAGNVRAEPVLPWTGVRWSAFRAPRPVWDRDFVYTEHVGTTDDGRVFSDCNSFVKEDMPDMQAMHAYVRAEIIDTGYVWGPNEDGDIEVTYVVLVNPKGMIPTAVVNLVAPDQALNVKRVGEFCADLIAAKEALDKGDEAGRVVGDARFRHIGRGTRTELTIELTAAGAIARLEFTPKSKNIDVSARVESLDGGDAPADADAMLGDFAAARRIEEGTVLQGSITATAPCRLVLVVSNEHSWFTGKTVYFRASVEGNAEAEMPDPVPPPADLAEALAEAGVETGGDGGAAGGAGGAGGAAADAAAEPAASEPSAAAESSAAADAATTAAAPEPVAAEPPAPAP